MPTHEAATPLQRVCEQCGAALNAGVPCRERFDVLLALDHSRTEPWGSRHGIAFTVFTLQHAQGAPREMIERCLEMLRRVYVNREERQRVMTSLRRDHVAPGAASSKRDGGSFTPNVFAFTIDDMGDFSADTYPADLDAWCRATIEAWSR